MAADRRGLTFLLSLGGVPIACAPENEKFPMDSDSTSTSTSTSTGDDAPTSGSTTYYWDTGFLTSFTEAGDSEDYHPPPPEHPACIAYYNTLLACFPERGILYAAYYADYCEQYIALGLRANGPPCADVIAAAFVCLSDLSCAELSGEPQCVEEFDAIEAACPDIWAPGDPSEDTDSSSG